eukprot:TRINITY_DN23211_c0_g1_i1.p1 TRINITY_DN23211_c0_g1~~TRINITY_DN23211_c0_g1_i1.p1  ORF type:complete len:173 (+),score=30.09 TRINITY_DN23211_c0_g1_i1:187-705(+)
MGGRARQLYGPEPSWTSSIWGPALIVLVVVAFCTIAWLTAAKPPDVDKGVAVRFQDSALGPSRDQRGCLSAAGFVWCEGTGSCIRPWKDSCQGGTDFCRDYCAAQHGGSDSKRLRAAGAGSHSVYCRCKENGEADDYLGNEISASEKDNGEADDDLVKAISAAEKPKPLDGA